MFISVFDIFKIGIGPSSSHTMGPMTAVHLFIAEIPQEAIKKINHLQASLHGSLALRGDGSHFVSLDNCIKTMHDTGLDMHTNYKETSQGGLAVNVIEC